MTQEHSEQAGSTATPVPEVLEALSAAIDRGHHLAVIASEGSGLAELYATAAAHDLAQAEEDARVFVLTASIDRAQRCAAGMYPIAAEAGFDVLAATPDSIQDDTARILVGPPALLLQEVRSGRLSAATLRTIVLDNVKALEPAWPAVEAILQACDGGRRIATTHERDKAFDDLVKHRLPRARRWPSELFDETDGPVESVKGPMIAVASRATRSGRLARLSELLHEIARSNQVSSVSVETAPSAITEVKAALSVSGFEVVEPDAEHGIRVGAWGRVTPGSAAVVFELPPTAEQFANAIEVADRSFAIVDTRHERQLELTAERAGVSLVPLSEVADPALTDDVEAFRARITAALGKYDLASGTLLLAPLIEEHGAGRVAAALAGLLRDAERIRASAPAPTKPPAAPPRSGPRDKPADPGAARAARPTWTRVFVGVGKRDGAGPGDLVGAITGETKVAGGQIGKIDVRQNFTLVDVDSLVAEVVVEGLDGRRIKGRQVVARLDRGASAG